MRRADLPVLHARTTVYGVRTSLGTLSLLALAGACSSKGSADDGGTAGDAGSTSSGGTSTGGTAQSGSGGNAGSAAGGSTTGGNATGGSGEGGSTADGSSGDSATGGTGAGTGGTSEGGGSGSGVSGAAGSGGATAGSGGGTSGSGGKAAVPMFMTRTLAMDNVAEGADVGDIDGDGVLDLVAGPRWYKGPDFALGGTVIANPPTFTRDQYSTFFLTFVDDVNGDGRPDVIAVGDAGGGNGTGTPNAFWYQNPGATNLAQPWTKTAIYSGLVANESPGYVNLLGYAKKELVFMTDQRLGYARPAATATAPWTFTAVTGTGFGTPYVHGLGAGDIDGDGLIDLVERTGWWRQTSGATWESHTYDFGTGLTGTRSSNWGGAQMQVYDVDGDGDADVVTSLAAHRYGLSWFEHTGTGAATTFTPHAILPSAAETGNFSQLHALVAADVNGDGLTDVVAGKRYYAHPSSNADPGTTDPPVLYWFELTRSGGTATFVPHLIPSE